MAEEETTAVAEEAAGSQEAVTEPDWKAEARKHEGRAKKALKDQQALEARLAEYDEASKTEQEKAVEKARKEAAAEAEAKTTGSFRSKILNAEIRAQAAGKFSNAGLAPKLLDLDVDLVFGDDGEPDTKAIAKAIDDFLAIDENAGLRAGATGRPVGSADAGRGTATASVSSMNELIRQSAGRT